MMSTRSGQSTSPSTETVETVADQLAALTQDLLNLHLQQEVAPPTHENEARRHSLEKAVILLLQVVGEQREQIDTLNTEVARLSGSNMAVPAIATVVAAPVSASTSTNEVGLRRMLQGDVDSLTSSLPTMAQLENVAGNNALDIGRELNQLQRAFLACQRYQIQNGQQFQQLASLITAHDNRLYGSEETLKMMTRGFEQLMLLLQQMASSHSQLENRVNEQEEATSAAQQLPVPFVATVVAVPVSTSTSTDEVHALPEQAAAYPTMAMFNKLADHATQFAGLTLSNCQHQRDQKALNENLVKLLSKHNLQDQVDALEGKLIDICKMNGLKTPQ